MTVSVTSSAGRVHHDGERLCEVRAGFIPLVDAAPLVIASAKGFDRAHGLSIRLFREVSWANIRDKVAFGAFDCAHMLAPMPIASALGLTPSQEPIIAPMSLNRAGSSITVSEALFADMAAVDRENATAGGLKAARALAAVVRQRRKQGAAPLTLGMVYPFSSHNFDLRYWLADAGIDADDDVNLIVIPPPLLAESLAKGRVDGFCVGAPWGSVAVEDSNARIISTKSEIWAAGPEKVLGMREAWAEQNAGVLAALIGAVASAADWLDQPENREEAARLLSEPWAIGVSSHLILRVLEGRLVRAQGGPADDDREFIAFHRDGSGMPWRNHALWLLTQMIRWGIVREPFQLEAVARRTYRPDLYKSALSALGLAVPAGEIEASGFAAATQDAASAMAYTAAFSLRDRSVDLDRFSVLNGRCV